jgi:phospholipid/cholesterol/gamma-HCH transport system substrate-binding protein
MRQNVIETVIGFIVLVTAIAFFTYAYKNSGQSEDTKGYLVNATFQSAEGIVKGSDVMIAGIKVGTVEDLGLDKESYMAQVKMRLKEGLPIPQDSVAAIVSQGLLGGKYVVIMPGADEENLKDNDTIKHTQSSINFESLIGKFMFSKSGSEGKSE